MDCGWDSVMIDVSHLPLQDNINITKEVVSYAHSRGVYVEGELGTIEGVEDEIVSENGCTADYGDSLIYVEKSGIDAFAPAVGTAHGAYKGKPVLQFELLERLSHAL